MASLLPFRALRPIPASASRVAAPPYDVVSVDEARHLATDTLSFLHVSRPEIDLPPGTDPHSDEVYARAVTNMARLREAAPLVTEEVEALYLYRLVMGSHVQTGISALFAVDDYEHDRIRKHERTRADKEDDRTRHVLDLRAQTGPVFLTYRASGQIKDLVVAAQTQEPLFDFTAADGVRHTIWRVVSGAAQELVEAFASVPSLYIADGHHRAAAAARARRALRGPHDARGPWDSFLAVAFPHDEMQILPYNRVVKDLGRWTPESLLSELRTRVAVGDGPPAPRRKGEIAMFLRGGWHTIEIGGDSGRLDVDGLQAEILGPVFGIDDPTRDPRLEFVGGVRGTAALEDRVRSGEAAVAFSLFPVSIEDLMSVSDRGGIMPPKSTWFEPKLRDGLLSHVI